MCGINSRMNAHQMPAGLTLQLEKRGTIEVDGKILSKEKVRSAAKGSKSKLKVATKPFSKATINPKGPTQDLGFDFESPSRPDASRPPQLTIIRRALDGSASTLRLSNGESLSVRRFFPAGKGDKLRKQSGSLQVFVEHDDSWIEIGEAWSKNYDVVVASTPITILFKEIETIDELKLFDNLRQFHYRGGGGAGRTVPLIATTDIWDLPKVLGFIEISSSMIANSARKAFFNLPYSEKGGPTWRTWDHSAAKAYSNVLCRISRFVIHPEIRGLGLSKLFTDAARCYAAERWHFGGYRPRFLEITADMLTYYRFIDSKFFYMGDTEGNERRLSRDMTYLIRRASTSAGLKGMPQGGGGIMTLQRGYANQLLKYLQLRGKSIQEAIKSLRYDASKLDQETWEALHRLNRHPKPCYIAGLTSAGKSYVAAKRPMASHRPVALSQPDRWAKASNWRIHGLRVEVSAPIAQSSEARHLQDAFGFVGSSLSAVVVESLDITFVPGEIALICGASGSGKSILMQALASVFSLFDSEGPRSFEIGSGCTLRVEGKAERFGRVATLESLPHEATPLDLKHDGALTDFLRITSKCGLAEPQLLVRSITSLSSGQRYRLRIALALLKKPQILIIDNFCEPLDRFTAAAVIKGLQTLAKDSNVAVIAATASYERLKTLFQPDQSILLRRGDRPLVLSLRGTAA